MLEAMNRNKENVANTAKKSNYEKLENYADQLTQSAQALLQNGENSLFEQAKASGDNQKVYDSIENLFENYNSTLKALRTTSNTMNDFYRQVLLEAPAETKEGLAGVGITFAKDGTATVDMEKKQTIVAIGAGTISKRVYPDGRIERCDNVKDMALYIKKSTI